jgi:hypothetical protein
MKEVDVRLQTTGTTLHLLFGGADLQATNVLGSHMRQLSDQQRARTAPLGTAKPISSLSNVHL